MSTKVCIKCGEVKDESLFAIHNSGGGVRTLRNVCKACESKRKRDSYHQHVASSGDPKEFKPDIKDLVTAYLNLAHWRPDNIRTVDLKQFNRQFNLHTTEEEFEHIAQNAETRLEEWGYYNPQSIELHPDGTYLVFGDTFGTHTPAEVFQLLQTVAEVEKVDGVVIIGHNIDDENNTSNMIASFNGKPVYLIASKDELRFLHAQRDYGYRILQDNVRINDIVIRNQEHITPYVKTPLSHLDPVLFGGKMIVNCTRHELAVRTTPKLKQGDRRDFIASPGSVADPHVVTTINRLFLAGGNIAMVRPTHKDSYHKHRKNETDKMLWERGYILVKPNNGVIQRRIFQKDSTYYTVAKGEIYDHKGGKHFTKNALVLSDIHAPRENFGALATAISSGTYDEVYLNGDIADCRSFNPHNAYEAARADLLEELRHLQFIMNQIRENTASKEDRFTQVYILLGNHEDFVRRFNERYPQFATLFEKLILDIYQTAGRLLTHEDSDWTTIGDNTIIYHGSADVFGVGGNNVEKTARVFRKQAIIGHTHSPAIRFGVYRTGCLCKMEQGYNNSNESNWQIGYARVYMGCGLEFVELVNN